MTDLEDRIRDALHDPRRHLPAWPDPMPRIRRSVRRQRAKATAAAVAAALGIAGIASLTWALHSPSPQPESGQLARLPVSHDAQTYHDSAGWSIKVPPGWHAVPFRDSKDGITSAGLQLSNVQLPTPSLVPGYPIQVNNRVLPARGIGLIIATDTDRKLSHYVVVRRLPLPAPNGRYWTIGSSLGGTPYMELLWFHAHGKTFIACAKVGPNVTRTDLKAVAAAVRSLR